MASVWDPPANTTDNAQRPSSGGNRRRGGGGDRGRRGGRSGRGGQAQGQGRGGAPRAPRNQNSQQQPQPPTAAMAGLQLSTLPDTVKPDADDAASDTTMNVCFICADPVKYSAIAPCNHATCHICSLRLRALYKTKACAHCRTESEFVIFTEDEGKRYEDFKEEDIVAKSDALGVKYDSQTICDDTTLILRYNCPDESCDRACHGWPDLHRHVRQEHGKVMCDLCTRNKKVFTHEHTLFTKAELHKHERHGDDVPGTDNQSGFKGHPECGFCKKRFYSGDELFDHCKHNHERCFICDRRNPGAQPTYFLNYNTLEEHFRSSHHVCLDAECLEKKFVVFPTEMDLKAHQLEVHPNGLSKSALRDARRVDLSEFQDTRPRGGPSGRRGGRGGRDRDGTRDYIYREPEESPVRPDQMSRQEIQYQRQLQIQSSQSTTQRTFGGQLSQPEAAPVRAAPVPVQAAPAPAVARLQAPDAFPPLSGDAPAAPIRAPPPRQSAAQRREEQFPALSGAVTRQNAPAPVRSTRPAAASAAPRPSEPARPAQTPQMTEEIRRLKHTAVTERASNLLRGDPKKIELFRKHVSNFRAGKVDGDGLVDIFWGLFDVTANDLGKLVQELAELYEDEKKQLELKKAWNNWKAINEDYPPIAGASTSTSLPATSTRVLKLKSSTAKSSRSTTARETAWGTAAHTFPISSSTRSGTSTPTSRSSTPGPSVTVNRKPNHAPPPASWSNHVAAPTTTGVGYSTVYSTVGPSRAPVIRKAEFPGLPPKEVKPANWTPVQRKVNSWEAAPPAQPVWGNGGAGSGQEQLPVQEQGVGETISKKKKGKQKEVLFRVGL